jgi:hypothetical protein
MDKMLKVTQKDINEILFVNANKKVKSFLHKNFNIYYGKDTDVEYLNRTITITKLYYKNEIDISNLKSYDCYE